MKFFKFVLFFITVISLQASQYNIIFFSTIKVYNKDKKNFLNRFSNGTIEKQKKYYVFKISHIKNYNEAKKTIKFAKRYYKDAFIIKDDSIDRISSTKQKVEIVKNQPIKSLPFAQTSQKENNTIKTFDAKNSKNIDTTCFIQKNISQESPAKQIKLKEINMGKNKKHIFLASKKVSNIENGVKLNEPEVLKKHQIPALYKQSDTQKYDILNFDRYIKALFNYNDSAKEAFYQKKIEYILSEIKKDRYNFDIYIDGYIRTGSSISTNGNNIKGNGKYTDAGIALNANKLLYDGQYGLINNAYDILYKRLADIKEINAKEKLSVLGTAIYTDMYSAQEELSDYKKMLKKHLFVKKIVDEGYKLGKNSILDYINAQRDYINIQRAILDSAYRYRYRDYVLRHSIKSKSKKPFKLHPAKVNLNIESLARLEREAIKHSSDIATESNILKIKEADLISQERRYYPKIDFTSRVGYGLNKDDTFTFSNAGKGSFWSLGLTFRAPIYERDDIRLSQERERYRILKQRRVLSAKHRDILIKVEKSYHEVERLDRQKSFLKKLLFLSHKKYDITVKRYLSGISTYKEYSDALKEYFDYKKQYINMEQNYIKELSLLSILVGKRKFYESY